MDLDSQDNNTISVKIAKSGDPVPVVDGIHLHSIYDPKKEAVNFIEKNKKVIETKSSFLVLGLGFGYHLTELIKEAEKIHPLVKVSVIEPNKKLVDIYMASDQVKRHSSVKIYSGENLESLYSNIELINFLTENPGLICHNSSFNIRASFYKGFMQFQASKEISSFSRILSEPVYERYFGDKDPEETFEKNISNIKENLNAKLTKEDFALFAFASIR